MLEYNALDQYDKYSLGLATVRNNPWTCIENNVINVSQVHFTPG